MKSLLSGDVGLTDWKLLVLCMLLRGLYLLAALEADHWDRLEVEERERQVSGSEFLRVETELVSEKSLCGETEPEYL